MKSFGKVLVVVIGLAALAFAAKTELDGAAQATAAEPSQAKRQVDRVRARASELEHEHQRVADDLTAMARGN